MLEFFVADIVHAPQHLALTFPPTRTNGIAPRRKRHSFSDATRASGVRRGFLAASVPLTARWSGCRPFCCTHLPPGSRLRAWKSPPFNSG